MVDSRRIEGDAEWRADNTSRADGGGNAQPPNAAPDGDQSAEDHRTMVMLSWALLIAGVITGFAALAAVIVAYVKRGGSPNLWRGHYDRVIRTFWIWVVLSIIGAPLILLFGLGFLILAAAAIYTVAVGVVGLSRAAESRPNRS